MQNIKYICIYKYFFVPLHAERVQTGSQPMPQLVLTTKRPKIMASIQDIQALEERIYDAVQEYLG